MIGQRTKRREKPKWDATRIPELQVQWKQDLACPPGFGTLTMHVVPTRKVYRLAQVPRKYHRRLLSDDDPTALFNQLLRMYLPVD